MGFKAVCQEQKLQEKKSTVGDNCGYSGLRSLRINYCLNKSVPCVISQAVSQLLDSLVFGLFDS